MSDLLGNRAHSVACSHCGAAVGEWCDLGGVRTWAIVHFARSKEAEFADALQKARAAL